MTQGKVEICGVNTAKLPILSEKEKEALFARIKAGDEEAKEQYIKGNLRLVLSVIKRFGNSNENPDDLFQIGCIGLIKAIDRFDVQFQVKFSTYAVPMIAGEIKRFLRDDGMIKAVERGSLSIEKLEAMTAVCSVGIDMVVIPGETDAAVISALIADEAAIGMVNTKTTAVRVIPAIGCKEGDVLDFGGLLGYAPILPVSTFSPSVFVNRGGRIPAPLQALKN